MKEAKVNQDRFKSSEQLLKELDEFIEKEIQELSKNLSSIHEAKVPENLESSSEKESKQDEIFTELFSE